MTNPTPLSLVAQSALSRAMEFSGPAFEPIVRKMIAAALQAIANQMAAWADEYGRVDLTDLLEIAAELEGAQ